MYKNVYGRVPGLRQVLYLDAVCELGDGQVDWHENKDYYHNMLDTRMYTEMPSALYTHTHCYWICI